jgi:hypothetical protein
MLAWFIVMFTVGSFDLKLEPASSLNVQFPDIKPRSIKQLVAAT